MFREETHMTENQSQHLQEFVEQAIASFNEKEMYLIQHDVSERCICACFAMHLMRVLENRGLATILLMLNTIVETKNRIQYENAE